MTAQTLTDETRFRASPHYQIIPFEQLTAAQQDTLHELRHHPGAHEILIPAGGSGHTVRSVDRSTADLLRTLRSATRLAGRVAEATLLRMVLDEVIEIECDGEFLSGVAAAARLFGSDPAALPSGRIGALSLEALRHAAALDIDDARTLAARLYHFNTRPLSPRWVSRLPDRAALLSFLGLTDTAGFGEPSGHEYWLSWRASSGRRNCANATTHKLYVSPPAEHLRDALPAVFPLLEEDGRASALKVGGEPCGLLRPDKLVVYFDSHDDLLRGAGRIQERLEGMPAHGVPFTADISGDGLLSWGVDPPEGHQMLRWQGSSSWRSWIANRLAASLLAAARSECSMPAWQFALERLRLDGVDTASFAPDGGAWPEGGEQ